MSDSWRHQQQGCVKDSCEDDEDHVDPGVVPDLVRDEAHERGSSEHTEGEDGVDEGDIDVTDANVLHVYGQVGQEGKSRSSEHEQSHFQRQQLLVHTEETLQSVFEIFHN